jgi:hypothetical protein
MAHQQQHNRNSDHAVRRSRGNRSRQVSSLMSMMVIQEETGTFALATTALASPTLSDPAKQEEQQQEEMVLMARRLRRAKRRLLLKSVEAPASPVDKFRSIVMNLSLSQRQETRTFPSLPFKTTASSRQA